ncbi:MAG TPA: HAD family hydrolase, partial [Propionibacteriaceae bacterium]
NASGTTPDETAYVGDRMDNDIKPAAAAGLHTIWIRRGPWGYITHTPGCADVELATLTELPDRLKPVGA